MSKIDCFGFWIIFLVIPFLCEAAPNFLSFFFVSFFAFFATAVAHGGDPQDRAASPLRFVPHIVWRIFIQNWYKKRHYKFYIQN